MIERLIEALQSAGLVLGDQDIAFSEAQSLFHDEDIADSLWLAAHMGGKTRSDVSEAREEVQEQAVSSPIIEQEQLFPEERPAEELANRPAHLSPPPPISVYAQDDRQQPESDYAETTDSGLPLEVQAAPALPNARAMGRSLRSLMRKAPSRTQHVLDEPATVERIAQEDIWIPVLQPAPERWFELELVIESSPFSFVWESTLEEFQHLLERQGAFRNVRAWSVSESETGEVQLVPKTMARTPAQLPASPTAAGDISRSPRELIDASGRALVLYVSDCRSRLWQSGKIHDWLKLWSQHEPTTVIQLLPERLWSQTELNVGFKVQVSAFIPGVANPKLQIHNPPARRGLSGGNALTLPVVTLTPNALQQWARVIAAAGQQRLPARLFDMAWVKDPHRIAEADWAVIEPQSPEARVELFNATASPPAKRLARLMSVAPVELPVVHLIQKAFFKESADPVHVAEVYDSCLLEQTGDAEAGELARYEFFQGVRECLNRGNPIDETLTVLDVLSKEITRTLGFETSSFTALLYPNADWGEKEKATILPFAQIATQTLHRLGGQYAELAQQVEQDASGHENWIRPIESDRSESTLSELSQEELIQAELVDAEAVAIAGDITLKTDEFTIATISVDWEDEVSPPELEQFEFTVATIERRQSTAIQSQLQGELIDEISTNGEWIICRRRHSAYRFIEVLTEILGSSSGIKLAKRRGTQNYPHSLELEMVSIPSGVFQMGAFPDEPGCSQYEVPQHEVAVSAFFMGRYPVTQSQWRFVANLPQVNRELDPDPSRFKGDYYPVAQVSWYEAIEFCDRLSQHTSRHYRLPTEAEWEYACRAGTTTPFHFGETITSELANYYGYYTYNGGPEGEYLQGTTSVDHFDVANAFGLSDMHGNVWEWCQDNWHDSYNGAPTDSIAWFNQDEETGRMLRGGAWDYDPEDCRSASRINYLPAHCKETFGFRVVCGAQ
ncbi:MAG: formylglycine-generating enzyme family protein [Leptolyngbyaceae cyanobacterium MO_188.B28]|nr:formylglycine-generating enzyme family protein [Leptolyngbyaceae cyanobacterium MO_188.B28]